VNGKEVFDLVPFKLEWRRIGVYLTVPVLFRDGTEVKEPWRVLTDISGENHG
jgi:hypothetical protein